MSSYQTISRVNLRTNTVETQLVSWSLTSLFSTSMAISEMKDQGELSLPTEGWPATFLFSSHPKRLRDQ